MKLLKEFQEHHEFRMNNAKAKKIFDGRFEILGIIGRGARSVVYRAHNIVDGGPDVALKVLLSDKDSSSTRDKLRKEALAMVSCHHAFVVKLDDFHSVGDLSYLSMEYAPLSDLRRYTESKDNKLPIDQLENFFIQTIRALDYIHSVGIIHRDIKPDNLLVVSDKELRIGDFGIALLPGDEQSAAAYKNAVGTMDYMAPEILEGKPCDKRTDIYALGVTFAELILGRSLFADVPLVEQLSSRENKNLPSFEGVPSHIKDAILSCLQFDREERPNSGKAVLQILTNKEPKAKQEPEASLPIQVAPTPPTVQTTPVPNEITSVPIPVKAEEKISVQKKESTPKQKSSQDQIKKSPAKNDALKQDASTQRPAEISAAETIVINSKDVSQKSTTATQANKQNEKIASPKIGSLSSLKHSYSSIMIAVPLIAFCLGLLIFKISSGSKNSSDDKSSSEISQPSIEAKDLRIASRDGTIDLSLLPTGLYVGSISRVHPGIQNAPIYLISDLENARLIVLLGIPGWKPTILSTAGLDLRSIRIASGGIVLEVSRLITNDGKAVSGSVKNLSLGAEGEVQFMEQN